MSPSPYLQDIAWAAGLFEGEGCITGSGRTAPLRLALSSSDEDVVRRFARIAQAGSVKPRPRENWPKHWKQQWVWALSGSEAERFLDLLLPHLGERRTARALELRQSRAEAICEGTAERTCPGCGIRFSPSHSPGALRQTYCTEKCYGRAKSRERHVPRPPRNCEWCDRPLPEDAWPTRKFCSQSHKTMACVARKKLAA